VGGDCCEVAQLAKFHRDIPAITKSMSEPKKTALGRSAEFGYPLRGSITHNEQKRI